MSGADFPSTGGPAGPEHRPLVPNTVVLGGSVVPVDVIRHIFQNLPVSTLDRAALTNRVFRETAIDTKIHRIWDSAENVVQILNEAVDSEQHPELKARILEIAEHMRTFRPQVLEEIEEFALLLGEHLCNIINTFDSETLVVHEWGETTGGASVPVRYESVPPETREAITGAMAEFLCLLREPNVEGICSQYTTQLDDYVHTIAFAGRQFFYIPMLYDISAQYVDLQVLSNILSEGQSIDKKSHPYALEMIGRFIAHNQMHEAKLLANCYTLNRFEREQLFFEITDLLNQNRIEEAISLADLYTDKQLYDATISKCVHVCIKRRDIDMAIGIAERSSDTPSRASNLSECFFCCLYRGNEDKLSELEARGSVDHDYVFVACMIAYTRYGMNAQAQEAANRITDDSIRERALYYCMDPLTQKGLREGRENLIQEITADLMGSADSSVVASAAEDPYPDLLGLGSVISRVYSLFRGFAS